MRHDSKQSFHQMHQVALQWLKDADPVQIASNADIAFLIPFLPRFPVTLKVWFADEEFPASGRLLLDASADHYFAMLIC